MFQVGALSKDYDVYVPDLLFFGGSMSLASDRSPAFQAECITAALRRLGVERCAVVGFSYGGFVAFRMAEAHPSLVRSVVATGTLAAMTRSTSAAMLRRLGVASWAEVLLPHDVAGVRSLFAAGTHRKWWLPPDRILSDYLDLAAGREGDASKHQQGVAPGPVGVPAAQRGGRRVRRRCQRQRRPAFRVHVSGENCSE